MDVVREHIAGRRVTVLGAARSGMAAALLARRHGALVQVSEKAPVDEKIEEAGILQQLGIPAEFGGHTDAVFAADTWIVSPGIPDQDPFILKARKKGIPVFGELEVSSWFCRCPIIAVTGSNGKSTTTAWIGEMVRAQGRPVVVAGNIGMPFSKEVEDTVPEGLAVLEVSNFQLETVRTFKPKAALFLNLTPDHLNRHGTLEAYGAIKARIFENQDEGDYHVINGRDGAVLDLARGVRSRRAVFNGETGVDCGFVRSGEIVFRIQDTEEILLPVRELGIPGEHNVQNALAAGLAARLCGISANSVRKALAEFRGLSHRMETVRTLDGALYVNDSKATNVDSVAYALGSYENPVILIAGGRDKDSDFSTLLPLIRRKVKAVVLIGEAADKMEKAFRGASRLLRAGSLEEAVIQSRNLAVPGDVVLLSPACASFDMFKNFEERGDRFRSFVEGLA
ncbi:UDP-N-acetylmuramoyl-L-alanine--D-glutamate ligase [bacterium]|nr:UDP-N-acetylmuramoyl-L-alanine--D-glutamate ligase [bacterium]